MSRFSTLFAWLISSITMGLFGMAMELTCRPRPDGFITVFFWFVGVCWAALLVQPVNTKSVKPSGRKSRKADKAKEAAVPPLGDLGKD